MPVKLSKDHKVIESPTCGTVHEILTRDDYKPFGLAVCFDIKPTKAHYHKTFDETYFVLDGEFVLQLYDRLQDKFETLTLKGNELAVISKGVHHKIKQASPKNRLCVISSPPFHADDETASDKL
ncbi:MAG: hypothetical protein ACK4HV_08675 [Parachlamydiaceae bacterium]